MVLFQEVANLECADSECLETRNWESRIGDCPALPYCIESVIKVEEFKQGGEDKVTRTMCFVWLGWAICATAWLLLELILVQQNEFVKSFEGIAEYPWVLLMIGFGRVVTWAILLFIGAGSLRIGSEISFRIRKLVPKANHNDKRKYIKLELALWGICVVGFFSSLVVGKIWMSQVADFTIGNAEGFVLLLGLIVIPLLTTDAFMLCVLWAIAGVLAIPLVRFTCRWVVFAWIGGCEVKPENGGDTMEAF